LQLVASGLDRPIDLTAPAGDPRLFVAEQTGAIRIISGGGVLPTPFLDLSGQVFCCGESGLLGIAFHPNYAANGRFFVSYSQGNGDSRIAEYSVSGNPDVANTAETVIIDVPQPASNHNGGQIAFGPDGYLYISLGDGGGGGDPNGLGQSRTELLGSILRIDVDGASPYAIPSTNPYAGHQTFRQELWNYGLRNPWRFSFDRQTGDMYIADVGQNLWEEIDFQPAASSGGENYGWNTMEGSHCFEATTCNQTGLTMPVLDYDHLDGSCSVTGGYVYRGTSIQGLAGTYFYADFCTRWVRSFRMNNGQATELTEWTALMPPDRIVSFGQDANGALYIIAGSSVHRIVGQ
jgi:glucose/arabinose dehydrogenase